jgi:hypothetical protein
MKDYEPATPTTAAETYRTQLRIRTAGEAMARRWPLLFLLAGLSFFPVLLAFVLGAGAWVLAVPFVITSPIYFGCMIAYMVQVNLPEDIARGRAW